MDVRVVEGVANILFDVIFEHDVDANVNRMTLAIFLLFD